VGGDYYDYFDVGDGNLGIAIGDVSGKGFPAALLMAGLRASLRAQTMGGDAILRTSCKTQIRSRMRVRL
jgi:sigma-B regulation protein RsbU (phosphoserine phosphatase)